MTEQLMPLLQAGEGYRTPAASSLPVIASLPYPIRYHTWTLNIVYLFLSVILRRLADEESSTFAAQRGISTGGYTWQVGEQVEAHDEAYDLSDTEKKILGACREAARSAPELLEMLGYRTRTGNFKKAIFRLCDVLKLLEPTLQETARSKNQKYRLTGKGCEMHRQEGSDE